MRDDFVEAEIIEEYNNKIGELKKIKDDNLDLFLINNTEDIYYIENLNPIGFVAFDIVNTTTSSFIGTKKAKMFYKKDKLFFKLSRLIQLFRKS